MGGTNTSQANGDSTNRPLSSDVAPDQTVTDEIMAGPQANFTLLDQMSEIKKNQSKRVFEYFYHIVIEFLRYIWSNKYG